MQKYLLRICSIFFALTILLGCLGPQIFAMDSYVEGYNKVSSSYKNGVYYKNLMNVPITGDGRTDVLAVALSQLGYQEGASDGKYSGEVGGGNNYTEFNYNMGDWGGSGGYGGSDYPWCASFVSFCLLQSRCYSIQKGSIKDWCRNNTSNKSYIWREISCSQWATQLDRYGYYEDSKANGGTYTPVGGDLIFFYSSSQKRIHHIGIVVYTDSTKVYTIEGNTSSGTGVEANGGGVYFKSYSLSSSSIRGYGVLPYKTNSSVKKIDYSGAKPTPGLYMSNCVKYIYETETATTQKWNLPAYTQFEVLEVVGNNRVKATCKTTTGSTVTGYVIYGNSDRIIQISANDAPTQTGTTSSNSTQSDTSSSSVSSSSTSQTEPMPSPAPDPVAPTILSSTATSVTLTPLAGYEYRVNRGKWQESNVFENLQTNTAYTFTQRIKATKTTEASAESVGITFTPARATTNKRLESLSIPLLANQMTFDPEVFTYDVAVANNVSELQLNATAVQGATVTISDCNLPQTGTKQIFITVTDDETSAEVVYTLNITMLDVGDAFDDQNNPFTTAPPIDAPQNNGNPALNALPVVGLCVGAAAVLGTGLFLGKLLGHFLLKKKH